MFNLDCCDVLDKAVKEVLNYFFTEEEKKKFIDDIELDGMLSDGANAVYFLLTQNNFSDQDIKNLKEANFCKKAQILLPYLFKFQDPEFYLNERLQACMLAARNGIDVFIDKKKGPLYSSCDVYEKFERKKYLKEYNQEHKNLSDDDLILKVKKNYTLKPHVQDMYEDLDNDRDIDSPHMNGTKALTFILNHIEKEESIAIDVAFKNRDSVQELKKIEDKYIYSYRKVLIAPSVVRENNKNLIDSNDVEIDRFLIYAAEKVSRGLLRERALKEAERKAKAQEKKANEEGQQNQAL